MNIAFLLTLILLKYLSAKSDDLFLLACGLILVGEPIYLMVMG